MALFLLFHLLIFSTFPNSLSISSDALLLIQQIKPALQGSSSPENLQLSSWNASSLLCFWRGLQWSRVDGFPLRCDLPAVISNSSLFSDPSLQLTSLHLPAAGLSGSLPRELGQFSSLRSLNLAINSLSGTVPLELCNSPSLSDLDLSGNALSGSLPPSLWNLCDKLFSIRLHGNAFVGVIPPPATPNSSCEKLVVLDFGDNRLTGGFPLFITRFRSLAELDLSSNRFFGEIPESMSGVSYVRELNLSFNDFWANCSLKTGRLSRGAKAGIVIGSMAGAFFIVGIAIIGWVQRRKWWSRSKEEEEEEEMEMVEDGDLVVFEGGEHLTIEEVLNATGQVVEKTIHGTVYKAKLADGGNIALRLLREGTCKDMASSFSLINQLGRIRHENLLPLRAFYHGKRGESLLIYDYLPNRTLHDLLHDKRPGRSALNWARRHKIALGVARGLAFLHGYTEAQIIHGTVRSKNVVVNDFFTSILSQYALNKIMISSIADQMSASMKTEGYKAPELDRMKKSNSRTDVYAFGILLLEILMGKKPGKGARPGEWIDLPALVKKAVIEETAMEVFDKELLEGLRSLSEEGVLQALRLAMGCCAPVASARPEMNEVVRILEENGPSDRSTLYSPAEDITGGAGTLF